MFSLVFCKGSSGSSGLETQNRCIKLLYQFGSDCDELLAVRLSFIIKILWQFNSVLLPEPNHDQSYMWYRFMGQLHIMVMEWMSLYLRELLHILANIIFTLEKWLLGKLLPSLQGVKGLDHVMVSYRLFTHLFVLTLFSISVQFTSCLYMYRLAIWIVKKRERSQD
jgi:hypothetical protein